jgi:hypothetical protein
MEFFLQQVIKAQDVTIKAQEVTFQIQNQNLDNQKNEIEKLKNELEKLKGFNSRKFSKLKKKTGKNFIYLFFFFYSDKLVSLRIFIAKYFYRFYQIFIVLIKFLSF